jgi:hypothetical protein
MIGTFARKLPFIFETFLMTPQEVYVSLDYK